MNIVSIELTLIILENLPPFCKVFTPILILIQFCDHFGDT